MNTEREHAELSASGAHRWATCTTSYQMGLDPGLPDNTSLYAERGAYLHDIAHQLLRQSADNFVPKNPLFKALNVTEIEAILSYAYYVKLIPGGKYFEEKVNFSHVVPGGFGTVDALIYDDYKMTVIDLKTGHGVKVKAKENYQLILYAIGALQMNNPLFNKIETIQLVIHQDIIDHVDCWKLSKEKLFEYGDFFREQAYRSLDTNSIDFNPAKETCQFCRAKGVCKAYMNYSLDMARKGFKNLLLEPHTLTNDEIAQVLDKVSAFRDWIKGVEEVAAEKLARHETISGFTLGRGRCTRAWTNQAEVESLLRKKRIPLSQLYNKKFISPAQAEKLGLDKYDIKKFIHTSVGKPVIVQETGNEDSFLARASKGFKVVA